MHIMRKLHEIGFSLISNTNNDCMAKAHDLEKRYLNFIELVFYKERLWKKTLLQIVDTFRNKQNVCLYKTVLPHTVYIFRCLASF